MVRMINPALDYIIRRPDVLRLEAPCSFMAHGGDHSQKVIAVHPIGANPDKLCIKTWHLKYAEAGEIMPPFSETMEDKTILKHPGKMFSSDTRPIKYQVNSTPTAYNQSNSHPVPQSVYEASYNNVLFSENHRKYRTEFLWTAFAAIFPQAAQVVRNESNSENSRRALASFFPGVHIYWLMWKLHMLDHDTGIAPELYYWITSASSSFSSAFVSAKE